MMRQNVVRKIASLSGKAALCCAVFFLFSSIVLPAKAVPSYQGKEENSTSFIKVEGLPPGSNITYQIFSATGKLREGSETVDELGAVLMPGFGISALDKVYHMIITSADSVTPVTIAMRYDPQTKGVSLSGSGFEEFAGISVEKESGIRSIKTDWAGSFDEGEIANITKPSEAGGFKVAFNSMNLVSDGQPAKTSIVQVTFNPQEKINEVINNIKNGIDIKSLSSRPGAISASNCDETGIRGGPISPPSGGGAGGLKLGFFAPGGGGPGSLLVNVFIPATNEELSTHNARALRCSTVKIVNNWVRAMMMMTEQFSAVMIYHVESIGLMLDAKHELESMRILETMQLEARKDYQPNDQMCRFGSFIRSVAQTESKAALDQRVINEALMERHRNVDNGISSEGAAMDYEARLKQFREVYCDVKDNNNSLALMCDHDGNLGGGSSGGTDKNRLNRDIDYSKTVEFPFTIVADTIAGTNTPDLQDVVALGRNLYWPKAMETAPDKAIKDNPRAYQRFRRIMAVQSVAHNSYAAITGMKVMTLDEEGKESGWAYIKKMMEETFDFRGLSVDAYIGALPSYYAQMEVLTKKMYQHPDFYTNLLDKPANVKRIGVSMEAIDLMQQRDQFESLLRREMLVSLMVEEELRKRAEALNVEMYSGMKANQR